MPRLQKKKKHYLKSKTIKYLTEFLFGCIYGCFNELDLSILYNDN